ncbi:hypothetical protein B296_00005772 [Ensete ventricosum]|uniref:[RNA-polymerase]-subunit kinase n=1 Tax=Ensete ventricosum TaxID=4639 RepID=A0A426ZWG8_ENSVE|nr:hypothetical protein B296_00005772 [Ensete ventricosum]
MGCLCSKGIDLDEDGVAEGSKSSSRLVTLPKKDEFVAAIINVALSGSHGSSRFLPKTPNDADSTSLSSSDDEEKKEGTVADRVTKVGAHQRRATVDVGAPRDGSEVIGVSNNTGNDMGIVDVPDGITGEYVAAGWPSWLATVAGEAINGWLPRRGDSFEKLDKIGEGTYSHVFRARDLETGKIVALKKVRFVNMDPESVRFMAREIHILRKLDHPNVIKLEAIVTSRMSCNLYLVFEYMEHDLAGLLARSGPRFTQPQMMRQAQANPKSISGKYDPQHETGSGFPIEPHVETARTGISRTGVHPRAVEPSWTRKPNQEQLRQVPSRTSSSVWVPNGPHLKPQMSCRPQPGAADFSDISGSLAARNAAKSRRNRLDVAEPAQKKDGLDRNADPVGIKDPAPGYGTRIRRIHYSGPLMPPGGNIEDMLKEHERQIQQAVRKSRIDKVKTNF